MNAPQEEKKYAARELAEKWIELNVAKAPNHYPDEEINSLADVFLAIWEQGAGKQLKNAEARSGGFFKNPIIVHAAPEFEVAYPFKETHPTQ